MTRRPATPIAVYTRTVRASLARIWENVLDWEHLPWLHASTFSHAHPLATDRDGWRVRVGLRAVPQGDSVIEVCLDRPARRYVTRTVDGPGAGTEIWTALEPLEGAGTRIRVEFDVADVPVDAEAAVAAGYVRLYTRLWDEDEAMMVRREALLQRSARVGADGAAAGTTGETAALTLGPLDDVRRRLPLVVEVRGRIYRIVEVDGALAAHATVCPHRLGPLEAAPVDADGCVRCPWHGYRYDVRTGTSSDGRNLTLDPAPVVQLDGGGTRVVLRMP